MIVIFNTTYSNKDAKYTINDLVGKPYSIVESFKLKGTGSKRMIIEDVSVGFKKFLNSISDLNYGNIEIRKKGILVHINKGLKNFTWAIPYYQLHIYSTSTFSIHAQGNFVRFRKTKTFKENKKFIEKLMNFKIESDKIYDVYEQIR